MADARAHRRHDVRHLAPGGLMRLHARGVGWEIDEDDEYGEQLGDDDC